MKGGKGEGSSTQTYYIHTPPPPSPPACAPPLLGVRVVLFRSRLSLHHRRRHCLALAGEYFRLRLRVGDVAVSESTTWTARLAI